MGNILPFRQRRAEEPAHLLLRLYDDALLSIGAARSQMTARNYVDKGRHISRAIEILTELSRTLDQESRLAHNLAGLYLLCTAKLLQASSRMETEPLDSSAAIIGKLRDAVAVALQSPGDQPARILKFS
ncbi:MAG: flagellar protein FliS [Desulfovibrio sp.]|nr:flagellar protein FliS [Desulfovibrio sp.]